MNFYTTGELRATPRNIWNSLNEKGEVVITSNGKPTALMLNINEDNFDEVIKAIRQARAMIAFNSMRQRASERGFMSEEEINAEIADYRAGAKE